MEPKNLVPQVSFQNSVVAKPSLHRDEMKMQCFINIRVWH